MPRIDQYARAHEKVKMSQLLQENEELTNLRIITDGIIERLKEENVELRKKLSEI